jgi:hypothetical protein
MLTVRPDCAEDVRSELLERTPSHSAQTENPHHTLRVTCGSESTPACECRFAKPPVTAVHTSKAVATALKVAETTEVTSWSVLSPSSAAGHAR